MYMLQASSDFCKDDRKMNPARRRVHDDVIVGQRSDATVRAKEDLLDFMLPTRAGGPGRAPQAARSTRMVMMKLGDDWDNKSYSVNER